MNSGNIISKSLKQSEFDWLDVTVIKVDKVDKIKCP